MVSDPAFEAAKIGDLETLKKLPGVTERLVDDNGAGCLHFAARGGSLVVIEYLIKTLAFSALNRSKTGASALHDAAARGNTAVVKWLIENSEIKVNDQDGSGVTPIHLAARYGHFLTVEWLLDEADADISVRSANGALPLHFAVFGGDVNCIKILIDENPRLINMQMNNGITPLYLACQSGFLEVAKFLVSRNAASKIKAYDGMSCLHAAAQLGCTDVVQWLVKEDGSNPNDRDFDGATPLHYAASRGHAHLVCWMMRHGGFKVTLDNLGGSPLHNAAELGEMQSVQALLECGCDVDLSDNAGLTAAELADDCHQTQAAALIRGQLSPPPSPPPPPPEPDTLRADCLPTDRVGHLRSPHLNFPPPPPFPPEEDTEVDQIFTRAHNTASTTNALNSNNNSSNNNSTISNGIVRGSSHNYNGYIHQHHSSNIYNNNNDQKNSVPYNNNNNNNNSNSNSNSNNRNSGYTHTGHQYYSNTTTTTNNNSTNNYNSTNSFFKSAPLHSPSPPLPPPPLAISPDASSPSTVGSPISPPTPLHEAPGFGSPYHEEAQETVSRLHSEVEGWAHAPRYSQDLGTEPLIRRTVSRISVDSSASNFGVFEVQEGAVLHTGSPQTTTVRPLLSSSGKLSTLPSSEDRADSPPLPPPPPPIASPDLESLASEVSGSTTVSPPATDVQFPSDVTTRGEGRANEIVNRSPVYQRGRDPGRYPQQHLKELKSDTQNAFSKARALFGQGDNQPQHSQPQYSQPQYSQPQHKIRQLFSLPSPRSPTQKTYNREWSSSSTNSQPFSPVESKHNLIADIQSAVSGNSSLSLRRAKSRGEGVSMVYQSSKAAKRNGGETTPVSESKPLTGEFDPKNFLDKVEKIDSTGRPIPEWRRQVLAKHAAEKAQKDFEENKVVEDYEARFKDMPAWKRALIERREAQAKEEEARLGKK
ncbi:espin [Aplysia californica]|uniref:Espin n=1 Tax=Aplysia californica TaxID=6500 RepID=A0ABM1W150_APLCA|nr:espin [Aplysia californica]